MEECDELELLLWAIGTQLYNTDRILYDCFDDKFKHEYINFWYSSSDDYNVKKLEEINKLKTKFQLKELFCLTILKVDYTMLKKIEWTISSYEDKIKHYKLNYVPIISIKDLESSFSIRLKYLRELNLDNFRKSENKVLHSHYYHWIYYLMNEDNRCKFWMLEYNDTKIFNTFHLSNHGDKRFSNIILKYIVDNNIIPKQTEISNTISWVNPFIKDTGYNEYKIKYSNNIGGFCYKIYLTARELQEIYRSIGSAKARDMGVMPFFGYINTLKLYSEPDTKFYLYFQE